MKRLFFERPYKFILIPLAAAAFLTLVSFVVMLLWNNLLPAILHVGVITFWQALGIFILCKILFGFGKGGRGFGRGRRDMRHRMQEHLKNMTPEQREKFKQKMGDRMCGGYNAQFGRHGFESDWVNLEDDAPKPTE